MKDNRQHPTHAMSLIEILRGRTTKTKRKTLLFILAGSYAQLTLLGQPKINSNSIQKTIHTDNQNGRVPSTRAHIQTVSLPERSNSTLSTNSYSNTLDTKKAKDSFERIAKQLEVRLKRRE